MIKKILSFFKTPDNIHARRKRILYHGTFLMSSVAFHAFTKYALEQGNIYIWLLDSIVGLISVAVILTSLYGKDKWVNLYFRVKTN